MFGTLVFLVRDVIPEVLTSLFLVVAGGLDSPIYREREAATRVLADFRPLSDAALRDAVRRGSPEAQRRAERLLVRPTARDELVAAWPTIRRLLDYPAAVRPRLAWTLGVPPKLLSWDQVDWALLGDSPARMTALQLVLAPSDPQSWSPLSLLPWAPIRHHRRYASKVAVRYALAEWAKQFHEVELACRTCTDTNFLLGLDDARFLARSLPHPTGMKEEALADLADSFSRRPAERGWARPTPPGRE